jgi:anaerobic dimethyl sulfoxide reductase subunit C (anchor subunit)
MSIREWALITFTLLMQMSVGAFLVLGVVHFFAGRTAGEAEADRLSDRALLGIGPVVVLSLLVSLFHLGNPLNAFRAVANLGTSWLSREILFSVLFTAAGALFALMQWRKLASFAVRNLVAWLAALLGVGLVFSMSEVYRLPTQPAWDTLATPVSFFASAILLGALAMGAAFVANYAFVQRVNPGCAEAQCQLLRAALRWIAVTAIVVLGIELITVPLQLTYLAAGSPAAVASVALLAGKYGLVLALRLALVFVGAGVLVVFLYQNAASSGRERLMGNLAYATFALVLVGEVLARYLFYTAHVKIGL